MNLTRTSLQELSRQRFREAKVLLRGGHWSGAYYIAGYAVECALKSCIVRGRRRHEIPFSKDEATRIYTHNLERLRSFAGLPTPGDAELEKRWAIVKDWSEEHRYRSDVSRAQAEDLLDAIGGRKGVLTWLRKHW